MTSNEFFKLPLNLLKYLGFLPKYEDSIRGKIWHGYAMITLVLTFANAPFQIHSLVKSFGKLDNFVTNIGTFTQILFLSLKLLTFYLQRETFNDLMENLVELTDKGESLILKLIEEYHVSFQS
jgi:hypothetical protein